MAVGRKKPEDIFQPDTVAQPRHKVMKPILPVWAALGDLFGGQRLNLCGFQPQLVDAKTGIKISHAPFKQKQHAPGVTQGAGKMQLDDQIRFIHPATGQVKSPCTCFIFGQLGANRREQPANPGHHIFGQPDRVRQAKPRRIGRRLRIWRNAFRLLSQGPVKLHQHRGAEALPQCGPGKPGKLPYPFYAQALKGDIFPFSDAQAGNRQRTHGLQRLADRGNSFTVTGQGPSRAARIGDTYSDRQAGPFQTQAHVIGNGFFTAEQVGRVYDDIEAKRRATAPLHVQGLLVRPVPEIH